MTSAAQSTPQATVPSAAKSAYLLVTHGSRDPRSRAGAEQLAAQLRSRFNLSSTTSPTSHCVAIATAVLELGPAPLHIQIEQFAQQVAPLGVACIKLLPLFLLPGVHVREDLPEQLAIAQARLAAQTDQAQTDQAQTDQAQTDPSQSSKTAIALELLPHLGAGTTLLPVLRAQQQAMLHQFEQQRAAEPVLVGAASSAANSATTAPMQHEPLTIQDIDWALLAHGSRRTGAVSAIANLAHALGARPAYWVGSPNLTDCVTVQQSRGREHQPRPLGCLAYFLFAGGITDRLSAQLDAAQPDSTAGVVALSEPLGAFPALVDVVADVMLRSQLTEAEITG